MSNTLHKNNLIINSSERVNIPGSSSTSFSVDLGQAKYIEQAVIESFSMNKKGLFNIHSGNNTFLFERGGTEYTVSLTPGFYSDFSLRTNLQTAIQVGHPSIFISENTLTGKLSFSSTLMYSMRYSTDYKRSPLSYLLGVCNRTEEANSWFPTVPTFSTVDMNYVFDAHKSIKMIHVSSETLASNNNSITKDGTKNNIILSIPNTQPESNFDALTYQSGDLALDLIHYKRPINIQFVDIKLFDANFEELKDSTMDFSVAIHVYDKSPFLS